LKDSLENIDDHIKFHFGTLYKATKDDSWPKYLETHYNLVKLRNNAVRHGEINLHPIISKYQNTN
jgi:hypothetical protein